MQVLNPLQIQSGRFQLNFDVINRLPFIACISFVVVVVVSLFVVVCLF